MCSKMEISAYILKIVEIVEHSDTSNELKQILVHNCFYIGSLPDDRENVKLLVAKCSFSSVYTSYVLLYFTY